MKKIFLFFLSFCFCAILNAQTIGVQLYTFRNQFAKDVKSTIEMIHKMGITEVEGGDTYGMQPNDFLKLLHDNNITVPSVGVDYNELQNPQNAIKTARLFGAKYVVCFWIPHNDSAGFTLADADRAIALFNKAGKIFADSGLSFCYHAHGYEFAEYGQQTLFEHILSQTNPKYVNFEMDVFWIKQPGQDPVQYLRTYPARFKMLHLKDRRTGTPNSMDGHADEETNVILGTGDVGIADIMQAAKDAGVEHYFIEDESSKSVQQVPESLKYLKSLQ